MDISCLWRARSTVFPKQISGRPQRPSLEWRILTYGLHLPGSGWNDGANRRRLPGKPGSDSQAAIQFQIGGANDNGTNDRVIRIEMVTRSGYKLRSNANFAELHAAGAGEVGARLRRIEAKTASASRPIRSS